MDAYYRAQANKGRPHKVFDWNKAARILRDSSAKQAIAGLSLDLEWTAGEILKEGKPVPSGDTYTYLSSNWATPVLIVDGGEEIECFVMEDEANGWDAKTYWPESALKILREDNSGYECDF
jgi:hypothetical protein